jgi:outer membrane biosynthesis protein TonB
MTDITDMELVKSSGNRMFDQSVSKAIEKSKHCHHFPEDIKKEMKNSKAFQSQRPGRVLNYLLYSF